MTSIVTAAARFGVSYFTAACPNVPTEGSVARGSASRTRRASHRSRHRSGMAAERRGRAQRPRARRAGPGHPSRSSSSGLSHPGFGVALDAMAASGDSDVLSTPHLIALDNVEAEINVGQNVPLQTSSPGGLGSLGGLAGLGGAGAARLRRHRRRRSAASAGSAVSAASAAASRRQDVGTTITHHAAHQRERRDPPRDRGGDLRRRRARRPGNARRRADRPHAPRRPSSWCAISRRS